MAKILISGGSGMLGQSITRELLLKGHEVRWLTRKSIKTKGILTFTWDPLTSRVETGAFEGVQHIIHLSGSNLGETAWTKKNKKIILDSRVKSAEFLYHCYEHYQFPLESFTGASAIGYYGAEPDDKTMNEDSSPGTDFMARVCVDWEKCYQAFEKSGIRTNTIRIGIVLSRNGGLYARLQPIFRHGFGAVLGNGKNYFSWIHEKDLTGIICKTIEDPAMKGVYNAVSSEPLNASEFSKRLAMSLGKKIWLPNVPALLIKLMMGEKSAIVLGGKKVSNNKLLKSAYRFQFPDLDSALADLTS